MEYFALPDFYHPFPSQIHPQVKEVHEHTLNWAQAHRLLQKTAAIRRFDASRFAWLTARAYPLAGFEELTLINDFLSWLFLLDDQFDDGAIGRQPERVQSIMQRLLVTLDTAPSFEDPPLQGPMVDSLRDLWRRTLPLTTSPWQKRFTQHLLAYFDSYQWETSNRMQRSIPEVETYIEKRQNTGAMWLALDYMDLTERVNLPPEIYCSSEVQVLLRITNNAVCWSNDIVSLEKEIVHGDLNNLVLAIQQEHQCTLQEAVGRVNALTTNEIKLFERLSAHVPDAFPDYKQELCKYIAVMQAWISGNLDWSFETGRYSGGEQSVTHESLNYLEAILLPDSPL